MELINLDDLTLTEEVPSTTGTFSSPQSFTTETTGTSNTAPTTTSDAPLVDPFAQYWTTPVQEQPVEKPKPAWNPFEVAQPQTAPVETPKAQPVVQPVVQNPPSIIPADWNPFVDTGSQPTQPTPKVTQPTQQPQPSPQPSQSKEKEQPSLKAEHFTDFMALEAKEEKKPDFDPASLDKVGFLEKHGDGFFGESWKQKYISLKHNKFSYYDSKGDPRPKQYVYLDESDVGLPKALSDHPDYQFAFQIINERKQIAWFLRAAGSLEKKKWLAALSASINYYRDLNTEQTIMEKFLALCCTKHRSIDQHRSFLFYTSKLSPGFYAIAASITMELLLRKIIDISSSEFVILSDSVKYTGIGLLDDSIDLLHTKIKQNKFCKLSEYLNYLCGQTQTFGDVYLPDPVLRSIDMATRKGVFMKTGPKNYVIQDTHLENVMIGTLNDMLRAPYEGTDSREHATLGIVYTMMKVASKAEGSPNTDTVDKLKIFPDFKTKSQLDTALDTMSKNLGPFDKRQALILKNIYHLTWQYFTGTGNFVPTALAKR